MRGLSKNIAFILLIGFFLTACKKTNLEAEESITCILESQDCPALTPLDSAVAHIQAYAELWNNIPVPYHAGMTKEGKVNIDSENALPVYPTVAHAISIQDMIAAFNLKIVDGELTYSNEYIRAYIGIEGESQRQHLYFTPIGENGEDSLLSCNENQYVMELTTPCPNTCGVNSPLFQAFNNKLSPERRSGFIPITNPIAPSPVECNVY